MGGVKITLGYLYPDIMSTYGDRGNVETILRRCGWRGISAEVRELRLGDRVVPGELDIIVIGSGGESQQRLIATDLAAVKGPGICEAVAQGAAALAVGGGYELFGRFCQPGEGAKLPGAGLFDAWTVRGRAILSGHYGTITEARADRAIGDLIVRWGDQLLVGFENHSGATYLGATANPLGQVVSGHGSSGNGTEGVQLGSAIGTHLRGPCLPKNPALADFLIGAAVSRRHGEVTLEPLADDLEEAAHELAVLRARIGGPGRGSLVRAAMQNSAMRWGPRTALRWGPRTGPRRGPARGARGGLRPGPAGRSAAGSVTRRADDGGAAIGPRAGGRFRG